jgi:hypothetical protein
VDHGHQAVAVGSLVEFLTEPVAQHRLRGVGKNLWSLREPEVIEGDGRVGSVKEFAPLVCGTGRP